MAYRPPPDVYTLTFLIVVAEPCRSLTHGLQCAPSNRPQDQIRAVHDKIQAELGAAFEAAKDYKPAKRDWLASHWDGFMSPVQHSRIRNTGVAPELLQQVRAALMIRMP